MSRVRPRKTRLGFGHVEVVVSSLIVGAMAVSAMNLLGGVVTARTATGNNARGMQYAQQMLTEISSVVYIDGTSPVFGRETGETTGNRSLFDDVDDYNGWTESPLQTRSSVAIANTTGWRRTVSVAWVNPVTPSSTSITDQGVKRIIITVQRNSQTVARLVCFRTNI